jgi:ribosome-binding factor A
LDFQRTARLNEVIKEEISDILQRKLKDPRIGFVTVTAVEVSPDLRHANIFVSILGNKKEKEATYQSLIGARGFIRSELSKRIRIKFLPEISFSIDESVEEGIRISKLIKKIRKKEESSNE